MSEKLTTLTNLLKYTYDGNKLLEISKPKNLLLNKLLTENVQKAKASGRALIIPVVKSRPKLIASVSDGGAVPNPGSSSTTEETIMLKEFYAPVGISINTAKRVLAGDASAVKALDFAIESGMRSMMDIFDIGLAGDSTGRLARVASASEASGVYTVTVDNTVSDFGIAYTSRIKPGMYIDIYSGNTLVTSSGGVKVTAVTSTSIVFSDVSGKTISDNDIIYIANVRTNGMINGLGNLVSIGTSTVWDDSSNTYLGLDRTAVGNEWLKGNIFTGADFGGSAGVDTDWDTSVIFKFIDYIDYGDSGCTVNMLLMSPRTQRNLIAKAKTDNIYTASINTPIYAGYKVGGLNYNNRVIPITVSPMIPDGVIYLLDTSTFVVYTDDNDTFHWLDLGSTEFGGSWFKSPDRNTVIEAWLRFAGELVCEHPSGNAMITDLKLTVA